MPNWKENQYNCTMSPKLMLIKQSYTSNINIFNLESRFLKFISCVSCGRISIWKTTIFSKVYPVQEQKNKTKPALFVCRLKRNSCVHTL